MKPSVHAQSLRCKEFKSACGYISQKFGGLDVLSFPVAGSKYSSSAGLDVFSFPVVGSKYRFSAGLDVPRFPVERSTYRPSAGLDVFSSPVEGSKYRWLVGLEFCILKMKRCFFGLARFQRELRGSRYNVDYNGMSPC